MNPYSFLSRVPRHVYLALAVALYALLLWLGGNQLAVDELPGRGQLSKLYHIIFYGSLALMLWFILRRPSIARVCLLVMLAGALDEFNQSFHPFRTAQVSDVVLDTLAALAAALALNLLRMQAMGCTRAGDE